MDKAIEMIKIITTEFQAGQIFKGKVVSIKEFGAFVEFAPGKEGMVHISKMADHRIEKPGDVLAEGEKVDVKITDIDMENKKVSLSIRALLEEPEAEEDAPAEE